MSDDNAKVAAALNDIILKLQARIEALEKLGRQNHQDAISALTMLDTDSVTGVKNEIHEYKLQLGNWRELTKLLDKMAKPDPVLYHNSRRFVDEDIQRKEHEEYFTRERNMDKILNRYRDDTDHDKD